MNSIALMSTTIITTWKDADLAQIGPIYPMVGTEGILVVLAVIVWIGFHILQFRVEARELAEDAEAASNPERLERVFAAEAKE